MEIGTIIDVVLAFVFMVSIVSGWHQGLVMKVASLIVAVISYVFSGMLSKMISPYIAELITQQISPDIQFVKGWHTQCDRGVFIYGYIYAYIFCCKVFFQKTYKNI